MDVKKAVSAVAKESKPPKSWAKYDNRTHPEKALKLALLGLTDEEMAVAFDVAVSTIYKWKLDHPDFREALQDGKIKADANVARSLYKKALEGDTTSAIFWLKNRRPKDWRDKRETTLQNPDGTSIMQGVSFVGIDVAAGTASEDAGGAE